MVDLEKFRFSLLIEVRFGDMDAMGHVNNARYFTYMESARLKYVESVCKWNRENPSKGMILAHISCDFKAALLYGDLARVYVRVGRLGDRSLTMEYAIVRENDGTIAATGESVQVAYDYTTGQPRAIPEEWRKMMIAFEPALNS